MLPAVTGTSTKIAAATFQLIHAVAIQVLPHAQTLRPCVCSKAGAGDNDNVAARRLGCLLAQVTTYHLHMVDSAAQRSVRTCRDH